MKSLRSWKAEALLASAFLLSSCAHTSKPQRISWDNDESEALKRAAEKKAPLVVDFHAKWCGLCFSIEKRIFRDPRVVQKMKQFLPLKLDVTKETPEDLATQRRYGVEGVPTIVLLKDDGSYLRRVYFEDVPTPEVFLAILDSALKANREGLTTKKEGPAEASPSR